MIVDRYERSSLFAVVWLLLSSVHVVVVIVIVVVVVVAVLAVVAI